MWSMSARRLGAAVLFLFPLSLAAQAEECRLEQVASLDMTQSDDGLLVPVSIQGTPKVMIIDTGAPISVVDPQAASELKLITHDIFQGIIYTSSGRQFTKMAVIHGLDIGQMHASDVRVLVEPGRLSDDSRVAGLLGADFLRHYDIDLDFGAHKLNLFSQNHCAGKVIYWPADAVAVVPMNVENSGHITVPVTLDGHEFQALFDTGAFGTIISREAAVNYFGIQPDSSDTPKAGASSSGSPLFKHVFKSLALEGIAINNPTIYIHENEAKYAASQSSHTGSMLSSTGTSEGFGDMTLGMNELRHLHVFVSYKEEKLYITAASPPAAAQAPPAATPAPH
jgi:predicted aspartyl protease